MPTIPQQTCKAKGCFKKGKKHSTNGRRYLLFGYCGTHYSRVKKTGSEDLQPRTAKRVFPLFSDKDSQYNSILWRDGSGYAVCSISGKRVYAHRLILETVMGRQLVAGEIVDHINMNKLDNRRENLRLADKSLNAVNRAIRADNKTGFNGVFLNWPKEYQEKGWGKRWYFQIHRKGHKDFYSKSYKTPEEAHLAREEKLKEYLY